ncbi:MAG: PadR family transcriptional regulator [Actinocatenispora sp.]
MDKLSRVTAATVDVLNALLDQPAPTWGLQVIKATGRPPGTVYPILERLERAGWVVSRWDDDGERRGPRRRIYVLTDGGVQSARQTCRDHSATRAGTAVPRPVLSPKGGLA